jgi:hypothetical protein
MTRSPMTGLKQSDCGKPASLAVFTASECRPCAPTLVCCRFSESMNVFVVRPCPEAASLNRLDPPTFPASRERPPRPTVNRPPREPDPADGRHVFGLPRPSVATAGRERAK